MGLAPHRPEPRAGAWEQGRKCKSEAIRLRLFGVVQASEFEARFGRFRDLDADLILNGHNPRPVEDARASLVKILDEGRYEVNEAKTCLYLWTDLF